MRRPVLTLTDGVVGVNQNTVLLHQRCHARRVSGVLHENQEGRGIRNESTVQSNARRHGGHAEFTYAVVDVVTAGVPGDRHAARPGCQIGSGEIGTAANQFRQQRAKGFNAVLGGLAAGNVVLGFLALLNVRLSLGAELAGQLTFDPAHQLHRQLRICLLVCHQLFFPGRLRRKAFFGGIPGSPDLFRHHKRRVGPAQLFAHCRHFVLPQRRAVGSGGAALAG